MSEPTLDTLVFGGTFDPIHHGHLIVARAVAETMGVPRVLLVPAAANPLKGGAVADGPQRLDMCRLAVAEDPLFSVSDIEIDRQPPSYTVDTVEQVQRQGGWGRLGVVVGADMLDELPQWHRVEELLTAVDIIIVPRPPRTPGDVKDTLDGLRETLGTGPVARLKQAIVHAPMIDISATQIRRRIAEGRSIRYLTPPKIAGFISKHNLYA
ncbi:MAG: nicotinate (nicotinamide) nucleotide adenylyltransferase [Planctomycetes bacterium]|jgi:nicotinate-nucleotide adenylyltransferase|nr:nicotinate-nucleotide adenylyltransferase [Phycisphaerae bacterium]NBB96112.1 nicotinate (nicotinamide) nucleotide adenylyltransferase [Planctomycetota bacterium]